MNKEFQNLPNEINPEILKQILKDRKIMTVVTRRSFFYFFYTYFGRYIKYPIAPFHFKMIEIGQDETIKRAGVMAFRNSAKSTILNTAYALWTIMGTLQMKHVVIASQTQARTKDHLMNIRKEIEKNRILSENLGPFREIEDRWHATTLIITNYDARITAISVEEGIRGLREGPHRPDLIIADDIEDSNSVKTQKSRDDTFNWLTGELLPVGDVNTKLVLLGNYLHEDSVLSRIEKAIKSGGMEGVFLRVPLLDENNKITWPGKFLTMEAVEQFRQSIGNEFTWQRDFLLRAIPDDYQIVRPEWIQYYDRLPPEKPFYTIVAIDPAASLKNHADYTAIVSAQIFEDENGIQAYILPNPINKKLEFPEIIQHIQRVVDLYEKEGGVKILVENTGTQLYISQELKDRYYLVEKNFKIKGDKGQRLWGASLPIQKRRILFPQSGCELLIKQITGFGIERYDDLVDAFTMIAQYLAENKKVTPPFLLYCKKLEKEMNDPQSPANLMYLKQIADRAMPYGYWW